jgi:hypothetical protein
MARFSCQIGTRSGTSSSCSCHTPALSSPRSYSALPSQPPRVHYFRRVSARFRALAVCQREGAKIVGTKPILPRHGSRAPKITRHVTPRYPDLPDDTTISGIWIGEVLVDVKGKVAQVWPIREPRLTPSFPPFNASIVTAIRQMGIRTAPGRITGGPLVYDRHSQH